MCRDVFIIMSLSVGAATEPLSHSRSASAIVSHAVQLTLFHRRLLKGYSPAFKLALQCLKTLYCSCQSSFSSNSVLVLAKNVDCSVSNVT
jgi:hypothetical protein